MTATDREQYKRPESVLVVVFTETGKVLLLKRADHENFWQSVTGSMRWDETDPVQTAIRELKEETGIDADDRLVNLNLSHQYEIFPQWRHRYAPGVTHNTEHAFALRLPAETRVQLNQGEHSKTEWASREVALQRLASWSNRVVLERVMKTMFSKHSST